MKANIKGVWALVTGASSGIGRDIAIELAKRGCHLVVASRTTCLLEELKKELESAYSVRVEVITSDLSQPDEAYRLYEECVRRGIVIEILVNDAGFAVTTAEVMADPRRMEEMLRVMLINPATLVNLFSRHMQEQKRGYILNVASIAAYFPVISLLGYGATKSFLMNFTLELRQVLKPYGIKVTSLLPGATRTSFFQANKYPVPAWVQKMFFYPSRKVAQKGVKALLSGRAKIVPGLAAKIFMGLFAILPRTWVNRLFLFLEKLRLKALIKEKENKHSQTEIYDKQPEEE